MFKIDGDVFTIRLMFLPYWLVVITILWLMLLPLVQLHKSLCHW